MIKTALMSLWDKKDADKILSSLAAKKVKIIATSGTAKFIRERGYEVTDAGSLTGYGEILGGRVKTLHPVLFAGILARRDNPEDLKQIEAAGLETIDLVVVNFYPFAEKGMNAASEKETVEFIDIGGPSLIRSAAKNHRWVTVLSSPAQYDEFLDQFEKSSGGTEEIFRKKCAAKAFRLTSHYDALIAGTLGGEYLEGESSFPFTMFGRLNYGENPHQEGYFLKNPLWGISFSELSKGLSYNNILDAEAAVKAVRQFEEPAVSIVKHQSLCGLAEGKDLTETFKNAYETDPDSAYGGIFAMNRKIDLSLAEVINKTPFLTMIIAPEADDDAKEILAKKKKRIIILNGSLFTQDKGYSVKSVSGGFLYQTRDSFEDTSQWETVSSEKPDEKTFKSLVFAQKAVMSVKSNAVVLAQSSRLVGIGGGNVSRIDSVVQACEKAGEKARGSVMASDAYFPFPDSIEYAREKGVYAVVQPGGSKMDSKVLESAEKCGMIMIFSKRRHFYH
ncbi:bifunctional phosphoribosylaminoimidazolecarboxamide formyltransferase/IMP cyclohydrolase [candidate division WOR-3 bacterium]|nr:bifunctional phosphoribosylaminoimidazolecarboxamide formyltransferase/IMP cyclohydrolase [candidate division WOR-3 bacterium]